MPPRIASKRTFKGYESKFSELNSKFETDYNRCIESLERKKLHQECTLADFRASLASSTGDDQRSRGGTSVDGTTKRSPRTSMKDPCSSPTSVLHVGDGERSTAPTFISPTFDDLADASTTASFASFLASPDDGAQGDETPLLKRISSDARARMAGVRDAMVREERELRKRLHYREKLRALTDRLATSSAVERSKELLANIGNDNRENLWIGDNLCDDNDNENENDAAGGQETKRYRKMIDDAREKLYACSVQLCYDDAMVCDDLAGEGFVISVPNRAFAYYCKGGGCANDDGRQDFSKFCGDTEDHFSDVSSLTGAGATRFFRFAPRHRGRHYSGRDC